jgi:hypothetical protein
MTSVDPTKHVPDISTSNGMIGACSVIGKSCSRACGDYNANVGVVKTASS